MRLLTFLTQHDIQQVILLKKDYPSVSAVILGGYEAPLVSHIAFLIKPATIDGRIIRAS